MKKVLIIGRGGREHALAHKFSQSPQVGQVFVAPGNPGMSHCATLVDIDETNFAALIDFAQKEGIDLSFVGPEVPLVMGIVDAFEHKGLRIFGPRINAAIIEGSKDFAKQLMAKYNIPTSGYETFTDLTEALTYVAHLQPPYVLKADGLAAGKGVVIAQTLAEAQAALTDMLQANKFGQAGAKVVIEDFLVGEEFSFMAFVHGENVYPMEIARDHKPVFNDNQGPNTGGMGAYTPAVQIPAQVVSNAIETVLKPTAKAMVAEGRSFTGILYAGLIATDDGAKVIEYNARFGDPEAEVLLARLNNDLYQLIIDILDNNPVTLDWSTDVALGVIVSSPGYPGDYPTGLPITGLEQVADGVITYHCGTALQDGQTVTNGGRVLMVTGTSADMATVRENVYRQINKIHFEGMHYRTDIGK